MDRLSKEFVGGRPLWQFNAVALRVSNDLSHALLRPSWTVIVVFAVLTVIGVTCLVLSYCIWPPDSNDAPREIFKFDDSLRLSDFGSALLFAIFGVFLVFSTVGCGIGVIPWAVYIDRTKEIMTVRSRFGLLRHHDLASVEGLQVCAKHFQAHLFGEHSAPFNGYELNAVFTNGHEPRRIRVMAHGNRSRLLKDAQRLAEFLNVPLIRSDQ